jgi:hypothetical protein
MQKSIMIITVIVISFVLTQSAFAGGVQKIGRTCPSGYRPDGSSGYCVPMSGNAKEVLPQLGRTCPNGYAPDGSSGYCKKFGSTSKDLIPQSGRTCPNGYAPDGSSGYCVSF